MRVFCLVRVVDLALTVELGIIRALQGSNVRTIRDSCCIGRSPRQGSVRPLQG